MQKNQAPAREKADGSVDDGFKTKENELTQIMEMFSNMIDKEIIEEYWTSLNADYEQTIALLSDMVTQIEEQNEFEQQKKMLTQEYKRCVLN
jgi:predicted Zn-dependent peptidase